MNKDESASSTLCKSCGFCCSGHLFFGARISSDEVDNTRALGLSVQSSNSEKARFLQPCPLWLGHCTIYSHPHKPSICSEFKCKLLNDLEGGQLTVSDALSIVGQAKEKIRELEEQLHFLPTANFRAQLFEYVERLEQMNLPTDAKNEIRLRIGVLLVMFTRRFGVTGFFMTPTNK